MRKEAAFCCESCAWVSEMLDEGGFATTYYKLTETANPQQRKRAKTAIDPLLLSALDSPDFIQQYATPVSEGMVQVSLFLDGMYCAACVWLIEQMPQVLPGVQEARADLSRSRLYLTWNPLVRNLSEVVEWLAQFGYAARPLSKDKPQQNSQAERQLLIRLGVSWAIAGNIMLLAFALYSGLAKGSPFLAVAAQWMSLILAVPSILYGAKPFYEKAFASLRLAFQTGRWSRLHMDVPIVLGISIGFIYSTYQTFHAQDSLWFDSLAVLIAALLTARWLQLRAHRFAQDAGEQLLTLLPQMARKVSVDAIGNLNAPYEVCSVEVLKKGDVLTVFAGEVFPADGMVVAGTSRINNAVLTGESKPLRCEVGDLVQAGSSNLSATVQVRVTHAANESRLGQLLKWVGQERGKTPQVVLWADRIGGYFIGGMVLLAALCFLFWYPQNPELAISNTVALLVITCPCALGMATPLAMAIGVGRAAKQGVFIKNSAYIQQLQEADTVILDKTGTLTFGEMHVASTDVKEKDLRFAAVLETRSQHPIATAFVHHFPNLNAQVEDFTIQEVEVLPKAIKGWVNGKNVWVGQPQFLQKTFSFNETETLQKAQRIAQQGFSPVGVVIDGVWKGVVAVGDSLRPEASTFIQLLHQQQKTVYLLSGDTQETAEIVGKNLGLKAEHIVGNASPEEKKQRVDELQVNGKQVVMVGDGVNDAGALTAAAVGIAVHGNSNIGMVSADIFVTQEGIKPLLLLFESAPKVLKRVRFNLAFSLLYNLFGAAAAFMGWVNPLIAAIAMPLSSLTVVFSSLLQNTFKSE